MPSKSKTKGNAFEREVALLLNQAFETTEFTRSPGSGAYFGKSNSKRATTNSSHAVETLTGDLITPADFAYTIECKCYAATTGPNPYNLISGSDRIMDIWLDQVLADSNTKNKAPLLFFKLTPRKGTWFVSLSTYGADVPCTKYHYNGYTFYIIRIEYFNSIAPYMI